ncbi:MAG: hypothetical protein CSA21_02185 [Deltaproteobacteria bacterium]|nr:MAG: hypothetical protein CSA21_02185 [Deltaproteobacteria bacterium]
MFQHLLTPSDAPIHMTWHDRISTLVFKGPIDRSTIGAILPVLAQPPLSQHTGTIRVNLQQVTQMDDLGAVVFMHLARCTNQPLIFEDVPPSFGRWVALIQEQLTPSSAPPPRPQGAGWIETLGDTTLSILHDAKDMLNFVGDLFLSLGLLLRHPGRLRTNDTLIHMQRVGADALPIVALISFLLGLIMAFMSAVQLEQFGANIYVASLVSLSMVRELGPIMTAIIVAGRSGSAFAAEIGSMRVAEEIDALTTLGFDITVFLVLPRLLATLIVQPLLTLFSDLFAVAGGLVIGVTMLDLTTHGYMTQTIKTLSLNHLVWSFLKTMLFALLIAGTGCFRGLQVRGGAEAVGRATTSSVVTSIFLIILADSILAVIQRYWG